MEKNVDAIMETIPVEWRKRWCDAERCACIGCVQIGNRITMHEQAIGRKFIGDPEYISVRDIPDEIYVKNKILKEEWEAWKTLQPKE